MRKEESFEGHLRLMTKAAGGEELKAAKARLGVFTIPSCPLDERTFRAMTGRHVGGGSLHTRPARPVVRKKWVTVFLVDGTPHEIEERCARAAGGAPADFRNDAGVVVGRASDGMQGNCKKVSAPRRLLRRRLPGARALESHARCQERPDRERGRRVSRVPHTPRHARRRR